MKMTFKKCNRCGQIIGVINDTGMPIICCGEKMETISPCKVEKELGEKHIPVIKQEGNKLTVKVGESLHPSSKDHFVEWVALVTNKGHQRKIINPEDKPIVTFMLDDGEKPLEVYAYCNIHSLWELEVNDTSRCK